MARKHLGKSRKCWQHFLLFPKCFSKVSFHKVLSGLCGKQLTKSDRNGKFIMGDMKMERRKCLSFFLSKAFFLYCNTYLLLFDIKSYSCHCTLSFVLVFCIIVSQKFFHKLVILRFNATLTAKVISWRSVTHMCFLAFSHQY